MITLLEKFGSNEVYQLGEHTVSILEGKWTCAKEGRLCDHLRYNPGDDCRHILKVKLSRLESEVRALKGFVEKMESNGFKHRPSGAGANYKVSPGPLHRAILRVLAEDDARGRPRKWIRHQLDGIGFHPTDTCLGGRISECLGTEQGWLKMNRDHRVICKESEDGGLVFEYDEKGRKVPLYNITERGYKVLREQDIYG